MNDRRMTSFVRLSLMLVSSVPLISAGSNVLAAEKPNIVLILADDLGWADLGCYGSKFHRTPHLDQLAKEGARFTYGYSACPVCSPTRAALMTGKFPARLHITDWLPGRGDGPQQALNRPVIRQELPLAEMTIADMLSDAGYATAHIGKWHLGGAGFEPTKQGFQLNIAGTAAGTPFSYFAPYRNKNGSLPGLDEAPEGEYLTDRLTDEAEKFIEAHKKNRFFLYLPHFAVHTPLKAPASRVEQFGKPQPGFGRQNNVVYAAMLQALDDSVGRIQKKLADLKLADNTLIIFTSDNGGLATLEGMPAPATINSPLREGKGYLYEGGIRVPFLVKWPEKIPAGKVVDSPVISYDILPTIADLCGLKCPEGVDGVSQAAVWTGSGDVKRDTLYWHYPHYANQGSRPGGAIRKGNLKLIEYYETGRRELFDVVKDVSESRNLAGDQPDTVKALADELEAWRQSVNAQRNTPNPNYHPNPQDPQGVITMPARTVNVEGVMLRFEPLPHKNTLGFWVNANDWAWWDFEVSQPGKFRVEIVQGCGNGSGGSEVEFAVGDQKVTTIVEETGGFQSFRKRDIGEFTFSQPGRQRLTVKALKKPGVAVMDLQEVRLIPVEK